MGSFLLVREQYGETVIEVVEYEQLQTREAVKSGETALSRDMWYKQQCTP